MKISAVLAAVTLAIVGASTNVYAASPSPSDPNSFTFGVQPANAAGPDSRPWLYYAATPGGYLTDYVAIRNYSVKPISVRVYAADASTNDQGQFTLGAQDSIGKDAGSWITLLLTNPQVKVPARSVQGPGTVLVKLVMRIPMNASPGDHGAGIIASLKGLGRNAQGYVITLDQRIATRVYVRISGTLQPRLEISDLKAAYIPTLDPFGLGKMRVSYVVKNTGNLKLGARQLIHIQGWLPFGLDNKALPDIPIMLPGGQAQVSTVISGVFPAVREAVTVRLTALQLPSDVNPYLGAVKATVYVWAFPWPLLVVILILAAASWRTSKWFRRPSRGRRARVRGSAGTQDLVSSS